MKDIVKGIIVVSIAIPVSIISMSVTGKLIEKYGKKQSK